jgi:hypothetical protein
MRLLFLALALVASQPSQAVEITNFRSGLACTRTTQSTVGGTGWICQPTEDVLITDQGTCVYNGGKIACTWVGFEFDYHGAGKETKLKCISKTSSPTDRGNPKSILAKDATSEKFELTLPQGDGHIFNPQYFTYTPRTIDHALVVDRGSCKAENKIVFEYQFNVHFPVVRAE